MKSPTNSSESLELVENEEEAKVWFHKALESADTEIKKGNQRFLEIRAVSAARLGLYDRAIKDITKVVSEDPDDPGSLYSAAKVYALAEMKDEAMEYVETAIRAGCPRAEFDSKDFEVLADDAEFRALLVADLDEN